MPDPRFAEFLAGELKQIREQGLWKEEWPILGPQGPEIRVQGREGSVLNFCANNYLGLSGHPDLLASAHRTLDEWGYGLSSVRFICGTQALHLELEKTVAAFLGMEDAILYVACFDANGGVFEPLLGEADAIVTDRLNHASIIDGVRLCKAKRYLYEHADMKDLDAKLKEAAGARFRLVVTDGVFSMDGDVAPLEEIVELARHHDARVVVDEAHGTGAIGPDGRGAVAEAGLDGEIDVIVGTLGKALGSYGAYVACDAEMAQYLINTARSLIFSTALPPPAAAGALAALELLRDQPRRVEKLQANADALRSALAREGFEVTGSQTQIVPLIVGDAHLAMRVCEAALERGIFAQAIRPPTVPEGTSRLRLAVMASHTRSELHEAAQTLSRAALAAGFQPGAAEPIVAAQDAGRESAAPDTIPLREAA